MMDDNVSEKINWFCNVDAIMEIIERYKYKWWYTKQDKNIAFKLLKDLWIQWLVQKPTGQYWKSCYTRKFHVYLPCFIKKIRNRFKKRNPSWLTAFSLNSVP